MLRTLLVVKKYGELNESTIHNSASATKMLVVWRWLRRSCGTNVRKRTTAPCSLGAISSISSPPGRRVGCEDGGSAPSSHARSYLQPWDARWIFCLRPRPGGTLFLPARIAFASAAVTPSIGAIWFLFAGGLPFSTWTASSTPRYPAL